MSKCVCKRYCPRDASLLLEGNFVDPLKQDTWWKDHSLAG